MPAMDKYDKIKLSEAGEIIDRVDFQSGKGQDTDMSVSRRNARGMKLRVLH